MNRALAAAEHPGVHTQKCLSVEQEVGGSSPPNCTITVELPRNPGILLISLTYLRLENTKGATNGIADGCSKSG
jgi:hypothetical protein